MIAFEMQNKESISKAGGLLLCKLHHKGLDIPECTSVLPNDSTHQAPPIRAPPETSLITSPNHRVYAGGPRFILDELHGMREDTRGDFF